MQPRLRITIPLANDSWPTFVLPNGPGAPLPRLTVQIFSDWESWVQPGLLSQIFLARPTHPDNLGFK